MKYKWEKFANKRLETSGYLGEVFGPRGKFQVAGVATVNIETGEAALILLEPHHGVDGADIAADILGDAVSQYNAAVRNMIG